MTRNPATLLLAGTLVAAGCDPKEDASGETGSTTSPELPCADETRDDDYAVGLSKMGDSIAVEFVDAMPAPPAKGFNTWQVLVTNAAGPVDGATIEVLPMMPDHNHGSPTAVVVTPVTDVPGGYLFDPVNLYMAGLWEVTIDATMPDETDDSVMFSFCVDP